MTSPLAAHRIATQFEALLFEPVLAPLESAFGDTAALLTGPLAQSIAGRERAFNAALTRLLERSHE